MRTVEEIRQDYHCAKCHNRHCITRELALPGSNIPALFNKHGERFVVVSCTLCGYSEFYSLRSAVKDEARSRAPAVEEST